MPKEFIQKLTSLVEANLANENFGPEELAREAGISQSGLLRKLKSINQQTISQFIREVRLIKAKELLQNEELTASEIAYRVGFGSPAYFNKCFREYFGVTPGELRDKAPESIPGIKPDEIIPKNKRLKTTLAGIIIGLFVVIPISYFLILKVEITDVEKDKSIAVLPFENLSGEIENQYQAAGMMDAILTSLSKIKDLRTISPTSVERSSDSKKTAEAIGNELGVGYLLEGSLQRENNQVRLIIQLIRTKNGNHVWSKIYDYEGKDVFSIQSEVAESVAGELKAIITPLEKQLIHKIPTANLTAFDYYLRGKDELDKDEFSDYGDSVSLKKAQHLFQKALELDSTFALAYTGLAAVYYTKYYWKNYLSENFMDSVLVLANKALTYDNQCAEAYYFRGRVYSETSRTTEALKEIDKSLQFNPNDWKAYSLRSSIFALFQDNVGSISNLYEVVLRNRGNRLPVFLRRFSYKLASCGFPELGKKYNQQALELDGDSAMYFDCLAWMEYSGNNFENAYQIAKSIYTRDSTREGDLSLYCTFTGRYEEAYLLDVKMYGNRRKSGEIDRIGSKTIAYFLWQTGRTKEAESFFNQQITYNLESIKLGRWNAIQRRSQFELAEVYTITGNKEKAYQFLDEVNKNQAFPLWWVILFKYEPYLNGIRQEPRFQKILKDVESKYQAEHERVGKWLEEQGIM